MGSAAIMVGRAAIVWAVLRLCGQTCDCAAMLAVACMLMVGVFRLLSLSTGEGGERGLPGLHPGHQARGGSAQPPHHHPVQVEQRGEQIAAMRGEQIAAMRGGQIAAMRGGQIAAMRGEQIAAMRGGQIAAMRGEQIAAM